MKKYELNIIKFDSEDVITTSGAHRLSKHFYCKGTQMGASPSYKGDVWEYSSSTWNKTSTPGDGDAALQNSDFVTPMVGSNTWYYYDGTDGKYHVCQDDHDYIATYSSR